MRARVVRDELYADGLRQLQERHERSSDGRALAEAILPYATAVS